MEQKQNPMLVKRHWHLLVFEIAGRGLPSKISVYAPSVKRLLSIPETSKAQASRGIPEDAVLIGHSYLGLGTQSELTGKSPVPPPSKVSTHYLEGFEAALVAPTPELVINPYDNPAHLPHDAQEWTLGFQTGANMRRANPATARTCPTV